MRRRRRRNSKKNVWLYVLLYAVIVIGIFLIFIPEIKALWNFGINIARLLILQPVEGRLINSDVLRAFFILVSSTVLFQLFLMILSQFIIPSENMVDRKLSYRYLRLYLNKSHGPVIRSWDDLSMNKAIKQPGSKPTIGLVDLNSALVMEKSKQNDKKYQSKKKSESDLEKGITTRVCLPGVNYLEKGEMIREIVDLRTQIRQIKGILVDTWEKIKLETDLFVVFSIGQPPDELFITFSEQDMTKAGIIQLVEQQLASPNNKYRIISDIRPGGLLDQNDLREAFQNHINWKDSLHLQNATIIEAKSIDRIKTPPYIYDPIRIQSASVLEVLSGSAEKPLNWEELPLRITIDRFRIKLGMTKFDNLYSTTQTHPNPMVEFRKLISIDMQNQGVLAYRLVQKRNNEPFRIGDLWDESELFISDLKLFSSPKILRNHGIKIIDAGFSELKPDETVRKELIGYWRARLKRESDLRKAESGVEINKLRSEVRNVVRTKMPGVTQPSFEDDNYAEFAQFLSLFLDDSMTNQKTRTQLSRETRNKLWELQKMLLKLRANENIDKPSNASDSA